MRTDAEKAIRAHREAVAAIVHLSYSSGNVVLAFDGKAFAKTCAVAAAELHKIDKELARCYLHAMGGITVRQDGCTATEDKSERRLGLSDI